VASGYYILHRGWFDSPHFHQRTLCERAAWIWLIEHACWKETKARVGGKRIMLQRGQLSYSRRYLAKAWHWHESRVQRFLNELQTGRAIGQTSEQGQRVITICNYDRYQDFEKIMNQRPNQQQDSDRTSSEPNKNTGNTSKSLNQDRSGDLPAEKEEEKSGQLVSPQAIATVSEIARKCGFEGGNELGLEAESLFLGYITEEPRDPDAAFIKWARGYLPKSKPN
jgi:AraC-like DNA-binding protein